MIEKLIKKLTVVYYLYYVAAIFIAAIGSQMFRAGMHIDPTGQTGIVINSILIVFIIGSIPITLALFNKQTKKWAELPTLKEKLHRYEKGSILRILIIGSGFLLGILFFFLMNSQSMIFSAGIAAIGLFFCKPAEVKVISDLQIEDPEEKEDA